MTFIAKFVSEDFVRHLSLSGLCWSCPRWIVQGPVQGTRSCAKSVWFFELFLIFHSS